MTKEFDSLSRAELQAAAKKHGVKANGASADIIQRLKEKVGAGGAAAASSSSKADSIASKKRKGKANEDEDEKKDEEEDESAMKDDDKSAAAEEEEEDEDEKPAKQPAKKKTKKGDDDEAPAAAAASSSSSAPAAASAVPDLKGKKFIVMGGFKCGKYKIESEISSAGGEVAKSVLKSLNYLVYGTPESNGYGGVSGPGSKKFKEAKKIKGVEALDETEFLALIAKVKGGGASAGGATAAAGPPVDLSQHPTALVFRSILKTLGVADSDLKPADPNDVIKLEAQMQTALPAYMRALLSVTDGTNSLGGVVDDLDLFPSVGDMAEQYGYNDYFPTIYKALGWIPFRMLDYDFCWEAFDKNTGRIYYCDLECGSMKEYDDSVEARIHLLDAHLKANPPTKPTDETDASGKTRRKNITFPEFKPKMGRMSDGKQKAFNQAYRKAERAN